MIAGARIEGGGRAAMTDMSFAVGIVFYSVKNGTICKNKSAEKHFQKVCKPYRSAPDPDFTLSIFSTVKPHGIYGRLYFFQAAASSNP
ncbi:MAG: hypothetical protein ACU83N_16265 [Gammaproteobacteria bacterium]